MMTIRFIRVVCALVIAELCGHAVTLRTLAGETAPQVRTYKTIDGASLKLHVFPAAGASIPQRRPAFVWIHGGGWTGGTAESGFPIARYFSIRGMVAFSVEYRLVKAGGPFIGDSLVDCKSAMRYIRGHAAELGVDPDRIAVAGDSAGGHLAAALGTVRGFDDRLDDPSISALPNAMLIYNGVSDVTEGNWSRSAAPGSAQELSPVFHVMAGAPPAIVLHGLIDTVVPPDQSRRFCAAMQQAGNRCDLVLVENARHAFVMPDYTAMEPVVVKAIRDGDGFLASLRYLQGPPTLVPLAPLPAPRTGGWVTRHQQNIERVKLGKTDVVFIGDSITQNYEKSNPPYENFKPTWDYFYGDRNAVNLGISGDTTGNVLWRLENGEFEGIRPKVAVILIGTNDTAHGAGAEQTSAGIDEIVKLVHVKSPSTKILLLGILPTGISDAKSRADGEVNTWLAKHYSAQAYVRYLDAADALRKDGKLDESLFYDPHLTPPRPPLHPDTLGQHRVAAAIEPVLARLLGDRCKCER